MSPRVAHDRVDVRAVAYDQFGQEPKVRTVDDPVLKSTSGHVLARWLR
jgi:hypothetical protein